MERVTMAALIFGFLLAGQATALTMSEAKASVLSLHQDPKISPPLKDVKSDAKFFGPNGDYADDKRPVPDKSIMDKLKGPEQPYPALQAKDDFDKDFVKDENSDKGAWQAQFEYDALRKKLAEEEAGVKRAQDRADREGKDADAAQKDDDAAGKKVGDAEKEANDASKSEEDVKTADDFKGPPSDEKLKELKKAVDAAEDRLAKQKKAFEECERQLAEAKKNLEDLKARQTELEGQLAAETKLWVEQNQKSKTVKLNLKHTREKAALDKTTAAAAKLAAANKIKGDAEKVLATQKAESVKAQANLQKQKAELKTAQDQLAAASTRLQKLHGYKPATGAHPAKSGAPMASAFMAVFALVGMLC